MGDREIGLASKIPKHATLIPAFSKARIERERTVHQRNRCIDVLVKESEHEGCLAESVRIVVGKSNGLASEADALALVGLLIDRPAVRHEEVMTFGR